MLLYCSFSGSTTKFRVVDSLWYLWGCIVDCWFANEFWPYDVEIEEPLLSKPILVFVPWKTLWVLTRPDLPSFCIARLDIVEADWGWVLPTLAINCAYLNSCGVWLLRWIIFWDSGLFYTWIFEGTPYTRLGWDPAFGWLFIAWCWEGSWVP